MEKEMEIKEIYLKTDDVIDNELNDAICKICYLNSNPADKEFDLISPCGCKGSIKYVHKSCLKMWRFKGKHIKEIKTCEQCYCEYKVDEDKLPHIIAIRATVIFVISIILILSNFFINSFIEAINFIIEDSVHHEIYHIQNNQIFHKHIHSENTLGYFYTIAIVIMFYQFFFRFKILYIINYIFTVWRLIQFNFKIDNIYLNVLNVYYVKCIYDDIYTHVDYFYIFLLNYR